MKKNASSKSKKSIPVKEGQKISSFFTKLPVTKSHGVSNSKLACFDDTLDDFKESTSSRSFAKSSISAKETVNKLSPKKQSKTTRDPKKKSPLKASSSIATIAKAVSSKESFDIDNISNNSDSDFAPVRKEKVVSNLLTAFKSKYMFIYDQKVPQQKHDKKVKTGAENVDKTKVGSKVFNESYYEPELKSNSDDYVIAKDLLAVKELQMLKYNDKSLNLIKQHEVISASSNADSQLVIELNDSKDIQAKISPRNNRLFADTPEKTYLQRDQILDITSSTNVDILYTNIPFEKDEKQVTLPSSTPFAVNKKRKFEIDSPDIIPPTPIEEVTDKCVKRKGKSKMCIENKFSKLNHPLLVGKYANEYVVPDMVQKCSPPKKIRRIKHAKIVKNLKELSAEEFDNIFASSMSKPSTRKGVINNHSVQKKCDSVTKKCENNSQTCENGEKCQNVFKNRENNRENIVPRISDNDSDDFVIRSPQNTSQKSLNTENSLVKSTSKFIVSPAKNLTPSKTSPCKGKNLKTPVSPSKSNLKTRRSLFKSTMDSDKRIVQETVNNIEKISTVSRKNAKLVAKNLKRSPLKLKSNAATELIDYFASLPSSNEEKKCVELDRSNFILTRKSVAPDETVVEENVDDFDDLNFDDGWDEEINNIEEKLKQLNLERWQYCKVLEVTKDCNQNLILKLQSIESKLETHCLLQGIWQSTRLKFGDIINIMASKMTGQIPFTVDNNIGYVIFEPDTMISPTSIVGSQFCKRRGILSDRFRGFDSENKVMIVGTLVHTLLEDILKKTIYTSSLIEKKLMGILSSKEIIYKSYSANIPIEELKNELLPFIPKMVTFINTYISSNSKVKRTDYKNAKIQSDNWKGSIQSIQDIEENIWCPQLGIKGKVDVTIKTKPFGAILPLELKTGRASMSLEHRGQVIIYAMIMTELGYQLNSGLLLYLREDTVKEVFVSHREKRDLMMLRNEVTYYLKQSPKLPIGNKTKDVAFSDNQSESSKSLILSEQDSMKQLIMAELPEPINHHSACKKCPYATICTTFLSRDNNSTISDKHPLRELSSEILSHLEPAHIDYFIHWTSLITIEHNYQPPIKQLKDIWRLQPYEREKRGKSLSYLKIIEPVNEENDLYIHVFGRSIDENISQILTEKHLKSDFIASGLTTGNYVVVSTDARVALATGFVSQISQHKIGVKLERNLLERYSNNTFHLDTYESQTIYNFAMTSIACLMETTEQAKRLRELIIDKRPPIMTGKLSKNIKTVGERILKRLNKIQQRAVLHALTIKDYLLIKGMPGTGKTATVVALIQVLVQLNKTVLITSHTHSAVDNVCLRLLDCGVDILRLGSENRVHPRLKHRSENALTAHCKTAEELKQVYDSARVVAVTCLAAAHPMFAYRSLDVCIIDESTQVVQCSVIKALLSTSSFILIGDPDQLPPVVRNPEAVWRGMSESLFERLDCPASTVTLALQYRMNNVITDLANAVTYGGQLHCADDSIGYAVLRLPKLERLQSLYSQEQWILNVLDTKIENSVKAIDTGPTWNIQITDTSNRNDNLLAEVQVPPQNINEDEERRCSNLFEAGIVVSLIVALNEAGVQADDIGIIAPYRLQVTLLKKAISALEKLKYSTVEVNTVDQYQGRDKDIIIYSCTRSRDTTKSKPSTGYEILEDKRRLTVAITRAKHKLILIGDFSTLNYYSPFSKLLNNIGGDQKLQLGEEIEGFLLDRVMQRVQDKF